MSSCLLTGGQDCPQKEAIFRTAAATALATVKREAAQSVLQTKLDNHRQTKADSAQLELQKRLELAEIETEQRRLEERKLKEERAKAKALVDRYRAEIEGLAKEKEQEAAKGRALREEAAKAGEVLPWFWTVGNERRSALAWLKRVFGGSDSEKAYRKAYALYRLPFPLLIDVIFGRSPSGVYP